MPKRFCIGCRKLYSMDATGTLRCPVCQARATTARNQRPSSSSRGLGWKFSKRKQADAAYQAAVACHWCHGAFTAADPKTADHITPRSQGGEDGPIVAAHRSCNSSRGGRLRSR